MAFLRAPTRRQNCDKGYISKNDTYFRGRYIIIQQQYINVVSWQKTFILSRDTNLLKRSEGIIIFWSGMTFKELQRANSSNCFSPNTEHHYSYDHKTTITSLMKHLKKKSCRILKIWSKINKDEKRISFF